MMIFMMVSLKPCSLRFIILSLLWIGLLLRFSSVVTYLKEDVS